MDVLLPTLQDQDTDSESDNEHSEDDEASISDDDGTKEANLRLYHRTKRRRTCVRGESLNYIMRRQSAIPNNPKTKEERLTINKALKNNVLFRHLDEEQLKALESAMFSVIKKKDEIIIKQGDLGDNFYIIDAGVVDIFVNEIDAKPQEEINSKMEEDSYESMIYGRHVERYKAGNFFGELAILYNSPRAATCIAKTNIVKLWAIDRISFKKIIMSTSFTKHNLCLHFLQNVCIFSHLNRKELSMIADVMEEESFSKGDVIFRQGDYGSKFYIIKEGTAICLRHGKDFARLGTGNYFCEVSSIVFS